MGIQFVTVEASTLPLIVCDQCEARIRNGDGNVLYRYHDANRLDLDGPHYLHKGCTLAFERSRNSHTEMWLSFEMNVWLGYLVRGAGYDLVKMAESVQVYDALASD